MALVVALLSVAEKKLSDLLATPNQFAAHNLCLSPPVGRPEDDATLLTKSAKASE
jgi:hypothetical protein